MLFQGEGTWRRTGCGKLLQACENDIGSFKAGSWLCVSGYQGCSLFGLSFQEFYLIPEHDKTVGTDIGSTGLRVPMLSRICGRSRFWSMLEIKKLFAGAGYIVLATV